MAVLGLEALEESIRDVPGVLGCVVLSDASGSPSEIQAFTRSGEDREAVHRAIVETLDAGTEGDQLPHVLVFELDAESHLGDRDSLVRAAELAEQEARSRGPLMLQALGTLHSLSVEPDTAGSGGCPGRPPLSRVLLSSSELTSAARVTLGDELSHVVGSAEGAKTPHSLEIIAEATLAAAVQIVPDRTFSLIAATLVRIRERQAVVVLVSEPDVGEMLGSSLVREAPIGEAGVRATLDAINRRLTSEGTGAPPDRPDLWPS